MSRELIAPVIVTGLLVVGGVVVLLFAPDHAVTAGTMITAGIANWLTPSARDAKAKAERRRTSQRPPPNKPPPSPPAATLLVLLALGGCGASALEQQANAATAVRDALDASHELLTGASEDAMVEAGRDARAHGEDVDVAIARARDRFEPIAAAHNVAVEAWVAWVRALLVAVHHEDLDASHALDLGRSVLSLYAELGELLAAVAGLRLPPVPSFALEAVAR